MLCLPTLGMLLQLHMAVEKKREEYTFRRQIHEKPTIIPGCPGSHCCISGTCCSGAILQISGCVACCCCLVPSIIASFFLTSFHIVSPLPAVTLKPCSHPTAQLRRNSCHHSAPVCVQDLLTCQLISSMGCAAFQARTGD